MRKTAQHEEAAFALVAELEGRARQARAAKGPASGGFDAAMLAPANWDGLGGGDSPSQAAMQLNAFRGWPYAAIRTIAQRVAGQPVRLARPGLRRSGGGGQRQPAPDCVKALCKAPCESVELLEKHPLLETLARPNPLMVQWSLLYVTVASLELTGRAYWWLRHDGGREIWPVPAHWIAPRHTPQRAFAEWEISPQGDLASSLRVSGDEVAYFYYPDPAEPFRALSPLQAQARAVKIDEAIQQAQDMAFRNGLQPGLAFVIGNEDNEDHTPRRARLEQEQRAQILASLRRFYQGPEHWREPLLLDALVTDVKTLTNKPCEMDFLESGRATKARITQGLGVNPIILGEVEQVNRASAVEARRLFADFTVNPKIELLSQMLTRCVAPKFGHAEDETLVWIEPWQPTDPELERRDAELLMRFGALTVNELRARRGLGPLADGDVVYTPPNLRARPVARAGER